MLLFVHFTPYMGLSQWHGKMKSKGKTRNRILKKFKQAFIRNYDDDISNRTMRKYLGFLK